MIPFSISQHKHQTKLVKEKEFYCPISRKMYPSESLHKKICKYYYCKRDVNGSWRWLLSKGVIPPEHL